MLAFFTYSLCVWKTSLGRRLAGGAGSPAPFTADLLKLPAPVCPPLTTSFSTKCSFVDLFFFFHGPNGIFFSYFGLSFSMWDEKIRLLPDGTMKLTSSGACFSIIF
uniref:Uncharacterized protein n=1 Tax=Pundamilia nyererei TaxID=303518 RepID=A0A3B4F6A1_9CICH